MATIQDRPQGLPPRQPLRIAIIGAGLVGMATYIALARLPDVQITVYERAPGLHETGAWIALTVSGLRALAQMLPEASFARLHGITFQGTVGIQRRHWQTGAVLAVAGSPHMDAPFREGRTHRIPLHGLLASHVPTDAIQYSKEVKAVAVVRRILENDRSVARLAFSDGSPDVEVDLVVAADGINSKIRRQYLPKSIPSYRGTVGYRQVFPEALVQHIVGLPAETGSWHSGNGEMAFMSRVGLGQYGFVATVREDSQYAAQLQWGHALGPAGIERLKSHFRGWDPLVRQVVDALPGIDGYRLETAPWLDDLTRDGVIAFVGDAAHPTAGAFGAGASFGYCDAWALYRTLASPASRDDVPRALSLYNRIRRPFLARVETQLRLEKLNGAYIAAAGPSTSAEWSRRWQERFSPHAWMLEHDVEAECQRVLSEAIHDAL